MVSCTRLFDSKKNWGHKLTDSPPWLSGLYLLNTDKTYSVSTNQLSVITYKCQTNNFYTITLTKNMYRDWNDTWIIQDHDPSTWAPIFRSRQKHEAFPPEYNYIQMNFFLKWWNPIFFQNKIIWKGVKKYKWCRLLREL